MVTKAPSLETKSKAVGRPIALSEPPIEPAVKLDLKQRPQQSFKTAILSSFPDTSLLVSLAELKIAHEVPTNGSSATHHLLHRSLQHLSIAAFKNGKPTEEIHIGEKAIVHLSQNFGTGPYRKIGFDPLSAVHAKMNKTAYVDLLKSAYKERQNRNQFMQKLRATTQRQDAQAGFGR